ncbi:hypothetical protein D3C80_20750 [compost metagenome]
MEHIRQHHFPNLQVRRFKAVRGKQLEAGEVSSGLYGIIGLKKDLLLRIAIDPRIAALYTECESRGIQEVFLSPA